MQTIHVDYIPNEGDGFTIYDDDHNEVITGTVMRVVEAVGRAIRENYAVITVENARESVTRSFRIVGF